MQRMSEIDCLVKRAKVVLAQSVEQMWISANQAAVQLTQSRDSRYTGRSEYPKAME
jgi:hypothetical protein